MTVENFQLARDLEQLRDEWFGRRPTTESRLLTRAIRRLRADGAAFNRQNYLEAKETCDISKF